MAKQDDCRRRHLQQLLVTSVLDDGGDRSQLEHQIARRTLTGHATLVQVAATELPVKAQVVGF